MFSKFPSIDQFRGAIKEARVHHGDADITLNFKGTVKLHGTNAAVAWDGVFSELVMQSRNRLITLEDDNAGFAKFVSSRVDAIKNIFHAMFQQVPLDDGETAYLYGEWCGKGIQKGVAVATLDPMFVMFNVAYVSKAQDSEAKRRWLPSSVFDVLGKLSEAPAVWPASDNIYSIYQFPNWSKDIRFTQPDLGVVQNEIVALTLQVEAECPVGKYFGVSGIGEGIVWTSSFVSPRDGNQHQLRFKVKGAEHSASKVKTLAGVDTEKLKNIEEFLNYSVTENRMEQGYDELYIKRGVSASIKDLGKFISWVRDDILKEESDTLAASGIDKKDLGKPMSSRVRRWFMDTLDREVTGDVAGEVATSA